MVKGMAKRVVVVRSPDKRVFEEAIFILRDDALRDGGVTAEDVLAEACRVARGYLRKPSRRWIGQVLTAACAAGVGWMVGILM